MKVTQQKIKLVCALVITSLTTYSQAPPAGTPPANASTPASCPAILNQAWFRGGNNNTITGNNIFGTMFNSPVYHYTSGQQRMIVFDNTWNTVGSGPGGSSTPNGGGLAINLYPASPVTRPAALLTVFPPLLVLSPTT